MTEEQFNTLQPFETNFQTAVYSNYSRNVLSKDLRIMLAIYNELTSTEHHINFSCGACQLDLLKRLGKRYFEYKASLPVPEENKEDEVVEKNPEGDVTPEEVVEKKPAGKKTKKSK